MAASTLVLDLTETSDFFLEIINNTKHKIDRNHVQLRVKCAVCNELVSLLTIQGDNYLNSLNENPSLKLSMAITSNLITNSNLIFPGLVSKPESQMEKTSKPQPDADKETLAP